MEAPLYYQGVARDSSAFRLLKQLGWQEGQGLGKDKQGITEHMKIKKKSDNAGIGVDAQLKAARNWTFNTTTFDNILKNLNVQVASPVEEESENEEPTAEIKLPPKKISRPQGRYKKKEKGKLVRGYSQTDLDAILGNSGTNVLEVSCCNGPSNNVVSETNSVHLEFGSNTVPNDWWGEKHGFVRGGMLGAMRVEKHLPNQSAGGQRVAVRQLDSRSAFCEQDQEDLYKLVQGKMTTGRQGIGIQDRKRKTGGAYWEGQKIILDNDDNVDNAFPKLPSIEKQQSTMDYCTGSENSESKEQRGNTKCISEHKISTKMKEKEEKTNNKVWMQLGDKCELKGKWKKECRRVLEVVPSFTMNIKKLHKHILEVYGLLPKDNALDTKAALASFKDKLERSSKFIIKGNKVTLAGCEEQE